MRSGATIDTGNVIVSVSPSAIFPLDGSITMPPALGFAFDVSSSCSSSCAKPAPVKKSARTQAKNAMNRRNVGEASLPDRVAVLEPLPHLQNGSFIIFTARVLESGEDRHRLRLLSRRGVRIARARLARHVTR